MTPGGMQPSIPTKSGLRFTLTVLVYATKREPRGKTFLDENIRFSSLNSSLSLSLPFRVLFFFLSFLDFFSTEPATRSYTRFPAVHRERLNGFTLRCTPYCMAVCSTLAHVPSQRYSSEANLPTTPFPPSLRWRHGASSQAFPYTLLRSPLLTSRKIVTSFNPHRGPTYRVGNNIPLHLRVTIGIGAISAYTTTS